MKSAKRHLSDLLHHVSHYGMNHIVISPGSRNASLTRIFVSSKIKCYSIVDERSAAFTALGMAIQCGEPVGILCTSGSALLNYGPAIAEAYYQRVPLIVISADRPARLIDQQDSQTIRQNDMFRNIVNGSYTLPEEPQTDLEFNEIAQTVRQAFQAALYPEPGPVHINVPIDEPLYENTLSAKPRVTTLPICSSSEEKLSDDEFAYLINLWLQSQKKMVVCGQQAGDEALNTALKKFAPDNQVVVVAENLSNLLAEEFIDRPDQQILNTDESSLAEMAPELIFSFGGHLVSKQLKSLLRKFPAAHHFRFDGQMRDIDTYQNLTREFGESPVSFFSRFVQAVGIPPSEGYRKRWQGAWKNEESDPEYRAVKGLFDGVPQNSIVHLGNSMAVRHVQRLPIRDDLIYQSNRGVAGIDGCLSTAAGVASATDRMVLCLLGDLSFAYDSNGLWNKALPENLRIAVINNNGGGIFKRLKGPSESPGFEDFFVADHPVNLEFLTKAYGLDYLLCDEKEVRTTSEQFFAKSDRALVLEIQI
jgi:2-succinyl-5-enolpyruvyl-6-hydroxy-3-cyclohexene-1-carboxylate synthase